MSVLRKYYLDTLRLTTIFFVILAHILMIYTVLPYYVHYEDSIFMTVFVYVMMAWLMPLLFTIAGITTFHSFYKRSVKEYLKERVQRLLIPFISAMVFLNPVLSFFGMKFHDDLPMNYINYYFISFTRITDLTGYDGGLTLGPAWFILYLFIVSCMALVVILLLKNRIDIDNREFSFPVLVLMGIIPVVLLPVLNTFNGTKSIGSFLAFFLLGFYVLSNDKAMEKLEKNKLYLGILSLILTVIYAFAILFPNDILISVSPYYVTFQGWILVLFLLTIGKCFINKTSKIMKYLSDASFAIYIFHETALIAIAFYVLKVISNIYLQMITIFILTISASFLFYIICKKFRVTRFLFGMK